MNEPQDFELLREFARRRTESCFSEIVRRYVGLVYSVARRMLGDAHAAEDVAQGVFTTLAQQAEAVASKLERGAILSGWLHVTTRNLAVKSVRSEVRRRVREQEAAAMNDQIQNEQDARLWDGIAPHLDQALAELGERDRDALLLRFFEGKTAREIGERLGLSESAAQKCVGRALEKLRGRFLARGVTVPSAGLGGILAANCVQAAPISLAGAISSAAIAAGIPSAAGAGLAGISAKITSALAMTKIQTATVIAVVAGLGIPGAVQQSKLNELRAGLAANASAVNATQPAVQPGRADTVAPVRESEAEEMQRLRQLADDYRARLAEHKVERERSANSSSNVNPPLLAVGRRVSLGDLVYAGNATPEATLQSCLAFSRDGDFEGLGGLMLLPEAQRREWEAMTTEGREKLAARMAEEAARYSDIEITEIRELDEHRRMLVVKSIKRPDLRNAGSSEPEVTTTFVTVGRTSSGWKQLPYSQSQ